MTGIPVDHIKNWYNLAHPKRGEGVPDAEATQFWQVVVKLLHKSIREGEIPNAFTFGALVIIPKDNKGGVQGIGLL